MQVERVRGPNGASLDGELNRRVPSEAEHALLWKQVLGRLHATQDLQKNGNRGGLECDVVDAEREGAIDTVNTRCLKHKLVNGFLCQ